MGIDEQIGKAIRKLRCERGLSIRQLSEMTGLTSGFISRLEYGKVSSSLHTLKTLAEKLETNMTGFFENDLVDDPCLNPPETWTPKIVHGWKADVKQMVKRVDNKRMQPFFTIIPPGGGVHDHYTHPGEEFVYVLEGVLTLNLNGEITDLPRNTIAYFSALVPHTWVNNTNKEVKLLWVCTPPSW